jgi:hypothetical protein
MTEGYRYKPPEYEGPREHVEIIDDWMNTFIVENEPFKADIRYGRRRSKTTLKTSYQMAFMGLMLLYRLVVAIQSLAHEMAINKAVEMIGEPE